MIEARCGRLCTECGYFEKCGGCIGRDKPVWAARCPIKSCCEEKKLKHCGQCSVFPCRKLVRFAKDKDYGDGGIRIDQCREWKDTDEQEELKVVREIEEKPSGNDERKTIRPRAGKGRRPDKRKD